MRRSKLIGEENEKLANLTVIFEFCILLRQYQAESKENRLRICNKNRVYISKCPTKRIIDAIRTRYVTNFGVAQPATNSRGLRQHRKKLSQFCSHSFPSIISSLISNAPCELND